MQTITFKVVKATLLTRDGTDQVFLQLEAPTPFPAMGYEPSMRLEAQKGKGAEWGLSHPGDSRTRSRLSGLISPPGDSCPNPALVLIRPAVRNRYITNSSLTTRPNYPHLWYVRVWRGGARKTLNLDYRSEKLAWWKIQVKFPII